MTCPRCGNEIIMLDGRCDSCGMPIKPFHIFRYLWDRSAECDPKHDRRDWAKLQAMLNQKTFDSV